MKAIVVYESHWGNTAAIAQAIAAGIGPEACALSTAETTQAMLSEVDLIVAGAPLLGFSLPTDGMLESLRTGQRKAPRPPDLAHPSMRAWLAVLPKGKGRSAAFETRVWWSPGSAAKTIMTGLEAAGYSPLAKTQRFIVKGGYGPLKDGELERARAWGASLAQALR